ncbi:MAG: TldD/PmbA family protein [Clostridiales bacterium]|nr:TldD/PmbA family protein [Clostridiales bacterium]
MNREEFIKKLFEGAARAGITECEAYFSDGESFDVDVLDGEIKEYSVSESKGVCLRGLYAGRMGYASTQVEDESSVDMLVEGVKTNAMLLETDEGESIFEGSKEYPQVDTFNESILSVSPETKIAQALEMEELVKARDPRVARVDGCEISTAVREIRIVNSKGMDVQGKSSSYGAVVAPVVIGEDGKPGMDYQFSFSKDPDKLDIAGLSQKAVDEAIGKLGATSVPSGQYECVFRRDAAGQLLRTFAGVFSGESARKGMSLLKGREGEKIASDCVTLTDDPLLMDAPATGAFDAEGVARFSKDVIKSGTFMTLLHNRLTAKEAGCATTANASKAGYSGKVAVAPSNMFIRPGEITPEKLYAQVGDGIIITQLQGTHSGANPISGDFSLAAKGYLIEAGKQGRPVEQITVAGNFFEILKSIKAVADDLEFDMPGSSAIASPTIYVGTISIAGI